MLISVLLIDDHQAVLEALSALLQKDTSLRVVDMVTSIKSALTALRRHHPQLTVLDGRLDEASSLDSIPEFESGVAPT